MSVNMQNVWLASLFCSLSICVLLNSSSPSVAAGLFAALSPHSETMSNRHLEDLLSITVANSLSVFSDRVGEWIFRILKMQHYCFWPAIGFLGLSMPNYNKLPNLYHVRCLWWVAGSEFLLLEMWQAFWKAVYAQSWTTAQCTSCHWPGFSCRVGSGAKGSTSYQVAGETFRAGKTTNLRVSRPGFKSQLCVPVPFTIKWAWW